MAMISELPTTNGTSRLRFGAFEMDAHSGELRKSGMLIRLKPQPFRVLWLLASRAGQPVLREQLRAEVWGNDTFVDFERGLNSCVTQIRAAIGDDSDHPRYIETLPKRGYRFIAAVEAVNGAAAIGAAQAASPEEARTGRSKDRPLRWAVAAVAVLAIVAPVLMKQRDAATTSPPGRVMLVVLPFENLSGDHAQDYFSDGLTEEMIAQIGGLAPERLGVIARTSAMQYKLTKKSIGDIGRELGVDYALEGSARRENGRIRVTAQLIQVKDQTHLWAESFDTAAEDPLAIQRDVAQRIAATLQLRLLPMPATHSSVPEAREAYWRGLQELNRLTLPGFRAAISHFEQAVAADPQYAAAYAAMAEAYNLQPWWGGLPPKDAFPRAKAAAEKALQLNPNLPQGHVARAFTLLYFDWNLPEAERAARRSIELAPGMAATHYWYGGVLSAMGRHDDALASMRRAQALDPLSDMINSDNGWYYFYARRYEEAVAQSRAVLERKPNFLFAQICIVAARAQQGDTAATLAEIKKMMEQTRTPPKRIQEVTSRPPAEAARMFYRGWLARLDRAPAGAYVSAYQRATLHAALGERDAAFAALERTLADRDTAIVQLNVDPRLDPLRADPRFDSLLQRAGLKQAAVAANR